LPIASTAAGKPGYKWIDRYEEGAGLSDRSRRPHSCPHETPQALVDGILEARRHHPRWGAKKLLRILRRKDPRETWPARTTVCDLLFDRQPVPDAQAQPPTP
jgi:homeodomain-containing protein